MVQEVLMSTKSKEVLSLDLGASPYTEEVFTLKNDAYPGQLLTSYGETVDGVLDVHADGDEWITGVLKCRVGRAYSADGSIQDNVNTLIAAGSKVFVYRPTGLRKIYMWLTGLTTGDGAVRKGSPIYMVDTTPTGIVAANLTLGAAMALVAGIDHLTGATQALQKIGVLNENVTILDDAAAKNGILAEVIF